jgi:hypothetical protein
MAEKLPIAVNRNPCGLGGQMARLRSMSDTTTSTGAPPPANEPSGADLSALLARQEEEILRLRDLLVSKDVELGAAKGRLAELDDRSARLASVATRIENRVPGLGRLVGAALRTMRSQRR